MNSRKNNKPLFDEVLDEYYRYIFKFVVKQVKNIDDAKDLTQGIFLKAYNNYKKFNPKKSNVKTWLFAIANNHIINFWRSSYVKRMSQYEFDFDQLKSDEDVLEAVVQDENAGLLLAIMVKELNARNLRMMNLYFFSNLSPKEIAEVLNMKSKTVSNVVSLSISKLKLKLEEKL